LPRPPVSVTESEVSKLYEKNKFWLWFLALLRKDRMEFTPSKKKKQRRYNRIVKRTIRRKK